MTLDHPILLDRTCLHLTGADAVSLMQGVITVDVEALPVGQGRYGALLTPQGKLLFDFMVLRLADGVLIDCPSDAAQPLSMRLKMYILRADVQVEFSDIQVIAVPANTPPIDPLIAQIDDPRGDFLGQRAYLETVPGDAAANDADYQAFLTHHGVPQFGSDFDSGSNFPHDLGLDQLAAIDFGKGCFVGQEVVSRMKHRGTARRRPVCVSADAVLPEAGKLTVQEREIGDLGSVTGHTGLAIIRIDRGESTDGTTAAAQVDGQQIQLSRPHWATWQIGSPGAAGD